MALEDVQSISQGAEVLAQLMNQGLSRDAAEETVVSELRAAQRRKYKERNAREGNRAAALEFLRQNDREFQSSGMSQEIDDTLDYDGEYQQVIRDDNGDIISVRRPQDDDQTYTQDEKDRYGISNRDEDTLADERAEFDKQRGYYRTDKSGKRSWREGGKNYSSPKFVSRERRGPDYANPSLRQLNVNSRPELAVPPEVRQQVRTTESEIRAERQRAAQDVATGARLDGVDLLAALRNEILGEREAREIAAKPINAATGIGQANLEKIQTILNLGPAKNKGGGANVLSVVPTVDPRTFDDAVRYVGPSGETVGHGRADVGFLGDIALEGADPNLEGAALSRNQQWIVDNLRLQNTGQTTVSDSLKPVSISGELQLLADRLNAVGYGNQVVGGIRSTSDFDQAIANMVTRAEREGKQLFSYNTEAGRNVASVSPGIDEVLNALHYSTPERQNLANALYALASAEVSGVQPRKVTRSDIQMDAGREMDGGSAPLAKVRNEKVGRGKKRQEVRSALAKLEGRDAQQPFIGAVEGEEVPRARFLSAKAAKMTPEERVQAYGPAKGGIANEVEARAKKARADREASLLPKPDLYAAQQRALDKQFEEKGIANRDRDNAREIEELKRLASLGANKGEGFSLGTSNRVIPQVNAGRRLIVPQESELYPVGTFAKKQPIQEAPVPTSIAPEPGTGTGNQAQPTIDAGQAGPQMPQSMREELKSLGSNNYTFMTQPDTQESNDQLNRRKVIDRIKKQNFQRRVGGAALAGGAIAGLAGLIGREREEREQEEMYR